MLGKNLFHDAEFHHIGAAIAAGSSIDDDSAILDMSGFENVIFLAPITDSVATGVATAKVFQNTVSSTTGAKETEAAAAATSAVNDDLNAKLLVVEVKNPLKRYVYLNRLSATANIAYGEALAILYNGRVKNAGQLAAEVAAAGFFPSPAEV